jgi:hypothetical protein
VPRGNNRKARDSSSRAQQESPNPSQSITSFSQTTSIANRGTELTTNREPDKSVSKKSHLSPLATPFSLPTVADKTVSTITVSDYATAASANERS